MCFTCAYIFMKERDHFQTKHLAQGFETETKGHSEMAYYVVSTRNCFASTLDYIVMKMIKLTVERAIAYGLFYYYYYYYYLFIYFSLG